MCQTEPEEKKKTVNQRFTSQMPMISLPRKEDTTVNDYQEVTFQSTTWKSIFKPFLILPTPQHG